MDLEIEAQTVSKGFFFHPNLVSQLIEGHDYEKDVRGPLEGKCWRDNYTLIEAKGRPNGVCPKVAKGVLS